MRAKRLVAGCLAAVCLLAGNVSAVSILEQQDADLLRSLGLFSGTESGDGLEQPMTRAQAAVMLVRLFGVEQSMPAQTYPTPFTDVPDWAAPYVSWLYQCGWTAGTSATTFSPDEPITYLQYALFLGRALGYTDNETASGRAMPFVDLTQGHKVITRGQAVSMTVDALFSVCADGRLLSSVLVENGTVDADLMAQAAAERPTQVKVDRAALQNSVWEVVPDQNSTVLVVRRQDGRKKAQSNMTFLTATTETGADGIFGYTADAIYYLDPQTLKETKIADLPQVSINDTQLPGLAGVLASLDGTTLFYIRTGMTRAHEDIYALRTWSPSTGWRDICTFTGNITQVHTLSTVQGKYVSGAFGILALTHSGTVAQLTQTPCHFMTLLNDILYFIPEQSVEQANGSSAGGHEVRMLAMGEETVVLSLPTASVYPICMQTVTNADNAGVITARGTWQDTNGNVWHVMFSGKGDDVRVIDADHQHPIPNDLNHLYPAEKQIAWWNHVLGLEQSQ